MSLIILNSPHVNTRVYFLFDDIPWRVPFLCSVTLHPIHSSWNLSHLSEQFFALWHIVGINHSSQGPGIGTAQVIAIPF